MNEAQHLRTYYGAKPALQDISFREENGCGVFEDSPKVREHIGYLTENPPLYGEMTPRGVPEFAARSKQISGREMGNRIAEVMRKTNVTDAADTLVHLKIGKRYADI